MRVSCASIADFLANLDGVEGLFDNTIRVNINSRAAEANSTKSLVTIQATTVVFTKDNLQYLLEAGEACGRDLHTSDGDSSGSERAKVLKQRLEDFCKERNWKILPGICSE